MLTQEGYIGVERMKRGSRESSGSDGVEEAMQVVRSVLRAEWRNQGV